ncbi:magnesium transporter MRS2-F-like [Punica granatum]|uniref:Magnesium transporter n=1 Tax=Punica granatum TaxID=22663 RepID=A0A6P8DW32_PUNGR|nr:magnesium transporter MRS2-F-like [Punica granatum]
MAKQKEVLMAATAATSPPPDEEIGKATAMVFHAQTRRKATGGLKAWLIVSESGESHVEEVGRHSIMRRTGLPARDLRVLDPVLSYPSSILGRERAIVVNLEHIKAIITATEVLMVNSNSPLVFQFVRDLQNRISTSNLAPPQQVKDENSGSGIDVPVVAGPKTLPFEFRALEACLESACRCLESETQTLEEEAYPALDELTSKISTLNLERVRQIKSRLVAISGRVQKVRDELEHLLDDDNDMAEMYLTEKLLTRSLYSTSSRREEIGNLEAEVDDKRSEESDQEEESDGEEAGDVKPNIEELEMLLEAYFAQIDGILQKLSDMNDYVDDTEDYINIMLDDKQNQLLQMGVMLSTANMIINAGIVVVGLFGMNITISLFSAPHIKFWQTTFGTIGGCVALYVLSVGWGCGQRPWISEDSDKIKCAILPS